MINRWEDAAFEQEHLLHSLQTGGYFYELCDGYQASAFGLGDKNTPHIVADVHRELLRRADPIYVTHNSMTLWEHARDTFEVEPLVRTDLVVPTGFALLPWPTTVTDVRGLSVKYRAVAWMPVSQRTTYQWDEDTPGQGVWFSLLSHTDDEDDATDEKLYEGARNAGWRWTLMHATPLAFNDRTWERFDDEEGDMVMTLFRHVLSLWRLMAQLVPTKTPLPRQARRSARRKKRPEDVTVIHLRRSRPSGETSYEGSGIEWDHQWMVRGHWRKQPYGPRDNPSYRQIWISPYIKGPEDKPFIPTKRAFVFDR